MKSIASAPGKIILFGEHFVVHGTKAILAAIDKRVTVTTTTTKKQTLKINSQLGTFEIPMYDSVGEDNDVVALAYAARCGVGDQGFMQIKSEFRPFVYLVASLTRIDMEHRLALTNNWEALGLEITIDSDIPVGVGLGSSSACCVAAAASLSAIFRMAIGKDRVEYLIKSLNDEGVFQENETRSILNLAINAEKTIFPDTSGADCTVCTYGGMIEYTKNIPHYVPPYLIKEIDSTFDLNLLIANSMIPHNTKNSVEKVNKFKKNDEERFSQLCDLENGLIGEVIVAMKNNDADAFGLKMSENQKYLEEIQVSNDTLRDMISSLNEISLGSKITGAGDGGCIIALVKDENMDKVPELLGKDKECFSAKIDTKGVEWNEL